ncbi:hypothetical protein PSACC_01424 [Paramicrosporidium saccamoebae]|uniref:Uncharacterized protein n=1 Tax=Paramicrosporidium saccamoebae TaxID=1246581 RepID=A0A2H9TLW6_9FUNG|nr:hypothetical protein PSACC_01424 [Paramicrosporidium saccamoebae]
MKLYRTEKDARDQAPENNDTLKANNEALQVEIRSLKELLIEAQNGIEVARRNHSNQNHLKVKKLELECLGLEKKLADFGDKMEKQMEEINDLNGELSVKNGLIDTLKGEMSSLHKEMEMLMRQNQELDAKLRIAESERDQVRSDINPLRRLEQLAAPGSPRSSMDVMESRLIREVGHTSKQLEVLAKTHALSQSEKEQLADSTRRLTTELNLSLRGIMEILETIAIKTGVAANVNAHDVTLEVAIKELEKLCSALLNEYESLKREKDVNAAELKATVDQLVTLKSQTERARDQCRNATESLSMVEGELEVTRSALTKTRQEQALLEKRLQSYDEFELPKYREQCVTLQESVKTLEQELEERENRIVGYKNELAKMRMHCTQLEENATKTSVDSRTLHEEIVQLRTAKQDLLKMLEKQENLSVEASRRLEDAKQQLAQAERTKQAVEENMSKEVRTLHLANSELRSQLAAASSGKNTNEDRMARLQTNLRYVEQSNEELLKKLQAKDATYSALLRERELLAVEKQTLERELADGQGSIKSLEAEVARLKRADIHARRGHDGAEHLQAKIDSLSSMNIFLKSQIESKETTVRDLEDKLRHQDGAIRQAYADCELQHQKIKKREMVISRVLKRLENINAVAGLGFDEPESAMDENARF